MSENQLKFNLKAVVDNLNLVNIVHKPEPILINKIGIVHHAHYDGRNVGGSSEFKTAVKSSGNFELIDETKMSMYSYLIQRDLKAKEWLSKYELNRASQDAITTSTAPSGGNVSKPILDKRDAKKVTSKTNENKSVAFSTTVTNKNPITSKPILKQKPPLEQDVSNRISSAIVQSVNGSSSTASLNSAKSPNEILELSKCCDDSIKSIENLYRQLSEFKSERLKIVYNDPGEEKKQSKQQLEQIKHLSRSMYDFQNQLIHLKQTFYQPHAKKTAAMTPIGRLIHTMRQVNRLNQSFADLYAYRPDNDLITEKLCYHFYKQMHLSVLNFSQCVSIVANTAHSEFLSRQAANGLSDRFLVLLADCDRYFSEFGQPEPDCKALVKFVNDKASEKAVVGDSSSGVVLKKSNNIVNIVRLPRVNHLSGGRNANANTNYKEKELVKNLVTTKTIFDKSSKYSETNPRIEISPTRKKEKKMFVKKTVRTAKLFPSKKQVKAITQVSLNDLESTEKRKKEAKSATKPSALRMKKSKSTQDLSTGYPEKDYDLDRIELDIAPKRVSYSLEDLNASDDDDSVFHKPAFEHLSSPKLKQLGTRRSVLNQDGRGSRSSDKSSKILKSNSRSPSISRAYSPSNNRVTHEQEQSLSRSLQQLKAKYETELDALKARHELLKSPRGTGSNDLLDQSLMQKFYSNYRMNRPQSERSILRSSSSEYSSLQQMIPAHSNHVQKLIDRLDTIRYENDIIRRKYENLDYRRDYLNRATKKQNEGLRRPYEECYLENESVFIEEFESKVNFENVYKKLSHPTAKQLDRVFDYSNKFNDYYEKTSVTTIGNSKFDDFELFELLSEDFFEECLMSVYEDLEDFNQELASNMINNEFDESHEDAKDVVHNAVELNESMSPHQQRSRLNSSPRSLKSPLRASFQKNVNMQASANSTYSSFDSNNDSFTTISN